jgi:dephospho-CoA kinase
MNTPPKLHVIGLTGGIASGKSTLREALAKYPGVRVLDADKLGHLAYAPGTETLKKLIAAFGESIVASDGTVDRPRLGAIVFKDASKLSVLNEIVWPAIRSLALAEMREAEGKYDIFILEAAVLVEANWTDIVDEIWVAQSASAKVRLMERNKLTSTEADLRIEAQRGVNERRLAQAHLIINCDGDLNEVPLRAERLMEALRRRLCSMSSNGSELVDVVDRFTNQVIDVRKRAVVRVFNLPHRATYVAIRHIPSSKFIVQQRSRRKEYAPGMFDPCPGGVVSAGETYLQNAVREMEEELGLRNVVFKDVANFWFESEAVRCWGHIYLCEVDVRFPSGFELQESEVEAIVLMSKEEILLSNRARMTPDGLYAFEYYVLATSSRL